jgi:DNA-binding NtrC family response regulator
METSGKSSNELVFIVDDEALLGQLAETLLSEAGYRTRTFLDPEDVLREIRDDGERPALLVTDYVMGTMNGLELIEECKKYHPTLRTILLSGTVSESYVHKFATRPDHFMTKPYPVQKFVRVVNETLQSTPPDQAKP